MAANTFQFTPETGFLDAVAYPTDPMTEDAAREQMQRPLNQIKDYFNNVLASREGAESIGAAQLFSGDSTDSTVQAKLLELRREVEEMTGGLVPDGSVTTAKLAADLLFDEGEY